MKKIQRQLGVITQTRHWRDGGRVLAYEPYIREMRLWADLFTNVNIFTSLTHSKIQVAVSEYERQNISFSFVEYDNEVHRWGALTRLFQLPVVIIKMIGFIWKHDVLLIRSPGHFTLIAHVIVFLFRKKSITKYAGLFEWFEGERLPSIIERNFIKRVLRPPHYVLVYGKADASHLISFIPATMSRQEIVALKSLRAGLLPRQSAKLVFYSLGKLIPVKNFSLAIHGLGKLRHAHPEFDWEYHLIGDGREIEHLMELCRSYDIIDRVFFEGKLPYKTAMEKLVNADCLIMPGVKEGWPKVVIESWAVGTVPVVANAGILSFVIRDDENGYLFDPEPDSLKNCLIKIFKAHQRLTHLQNNGWREVDKFSMEEFAAKVQYVCREKFLL